MMLGLGVGAFLAIRYLMWEVAHRPTWSMGRGRVLAAARREKSRQPVAGVVILAALVLLPFLYARTGYAPQGFFLLFGVAFWMIFQRSRFCLVRAFPEPLLCGNAVYARAETPAVIFWTLGSGMHSFPYLY